ncbi:MAG: TonB-dependent receptor family protein [Chitinophagaceae bacterium]|nr:TonB-dependent receptor family protein [Chitinophagaceae bacterium]MBK9661405.1 TonB-dependent receptor family protein [Chitinophagaceae bacterium]MBK9937534.1 TonB-dependent receptor family protein [Chitinophagaceae bacterium]MBP6416374.1 TonB-dependent receptor family protein [Chitinophagaceae bacterium]HQW42705.1 outer membrane beta-barrel family protein [Chitinophagaceae bacterium]
MRKVYLLLLAACFTTTLLAQKNGSVKGIAFDTISKLPVAAATITVLERKDSSLVTFTMTGNDGRFELKGLANGEYRLMISHVSYYNTNKYFTITDADKNAELGNVVLNDKAKILEEVVLAAEAPPVTLVGDTIQYNAGSFKTPPNASVEQLLKKLPGVKVEKDGTIKAQGEKVSRVLVDGKEFFGNDPKVATRNLPADAVDKVQVYDKQSDQAQLTGFEDGNYEKTINLKLKKDKKKGVFGKINAGAGNKERYEGKFNVNSFKGARQFSAIGMGNNTNAEGFSFMDILNFTGELSRMQRGGGGNINLNVSGDEAAAMGINAGGRNNGINTAWGGGLNYNNIIGTKLDFQSNYFYNRFNPNQESHLQRQYFLPDSSYFYNQNSFTDNLNNNHRFNLNTLFQVDSMNSIRITPSFSYQKTNNRSQTDYQTLSEDKIFTNDGFSNTTSASQGYNFRNDIIWRKKFSRKGRTFSLSLQTSLNESDGDGSLSSINSFFTPAGALLKRDTLNQQSNIKGDLRGYNVRAVYTEPVWKKSLLEFSVSKSNTSSTSEKITYDYNKLNGKFDQYNNILSNDFENTYGFINAGMRMRTQKKKFSYSFGANWQQAELEGKITTGIKDSLISKTFRNILPNARLQYNFTRFKSLSVSYNTATNQPTMAQLQPVPDNSNSLNIREGNPDLKQEYNHTLQTHLNLVSPYKNKNLFMFLTMQATQNKIVNYDSINQLGVKRTKPVNVNGVYTVNSSISYSMPVRFLKGSVEISSNTGIFKTKQFINTVGNSIQTFSVGPELRLDMNPTEKLSLGFSAGFNYNKTKYSLQSALNTNYLSQEYNASLDWEMPKGFFFSTDFMYTINSQRAAGFNIKVPLWNASISKQMLKFNRGELKFAVRDLLNKNVGISRNTNNNYIEDARVLTLRQFFLLSFTYSLSKTGLNNAGGSGGMRVITR